MTRQIEWFPRHIVVDNYKKVFEYPVARWAWNSLVVASTATALGVLFGAMAGYALARLNFPGKNLLFGVLIASLMIPTEMTIVPMFVGFLKANLANSYTALILPAVANVFSVYIFRQFFLGLPPELEDAAAIDGANRFVIFLRIALPLARAPLIAATILLFTLNWNSFLWPLLIVFDDSMKTMPVGIAAFTPVVGTHTQLEGFGIAMAGVTLLSLPSLLIFFVLQRYFIEGISQTGIKG
jgi:multiple sugar transport system permease protein